MDASPGRNTKASAAVWIVGILLVPLLGVYPLYMDNAELEFFQGGTDRLYPETVKERLGL